ncbi:MAG: hypothetical protein M0R06_03840 [Sphaerochaeta sp.]|jgi:hypothetical protein|nr:hypothetical protein [Sphaerochaeta sp.]
MKANWTDVSTPKMKRFTADYKDSRIAVENTGRYPKKPWVAWIGGLRMRSSAQPTAEAAKLYAENLVDEINGIGKTWPKDGKKEKAK